jgi:SAM-dependent methyltransferase
VTGIACRICGNTSGNRLHRAREMQFGTGEVFDYVECAGCGCVQIAAVPADLERFYPSAYPPHAPPAERPAGIVGFLRRLRSALLYGVSGRQHALPIPGATYHAWIRKAGVGTGSAIVDVGAGSGQLLRKMQADGFRNLTGIDPYLGQEVTEPGLVLRRGQLSDLAGSFDLVMMHHSFEHIADQAGALREVARAVGEKGVALVRVPVADSFAWRHYGVDWFQLDAPRHLYLHTRRSIGILAAGAGLRVSDVVCDSRENQFWASELYRQGLSLVDPATSRPRRAAAHFGRAELRAFRARARELNAAGEGDQACFYMVRA